MKTKLFAVLTATILLFTCLSAGSAVSAATYGDFTYSFNGDEVVITSCDQEASGDVEIPEKIFGYPVTTIDDYAFENCYDVTSVTIPSTVTYIGEEVFYGCYSLVDVYFDGTEEQWDDVLLGYGNSFTVEFLQDGTDDGINTVLIVVVVELVAVLIMMMIILVMRKKRLKNLKV